MSASSVKNIALRNWENSKEIKNISASNKRHSSIYLLLIVTIFSSITSLTFLVWALHLRDSMAIHNFNFHNHEIEHVVEIEGR